PDLGDLRDLAEGLEVAHLLAQRGDAALDLDDAEGGDLRLLRRRELLGDDLALLDVGELVVAELDDLAQERARRRLRGRALGLHGRSREHEGRQDERGENHALTHDHLTPAKLFETGRPVNATLARPSRARRDRLDPLLVAAEALRVAARGEGLVLRIR